MPAGASGHFATTLGLPLLTALADLLGILGGMLIASQFGIAPAFYQQSVVSIVELSDFMQSLTKAGVFGFLIGMVGCYTGLRTTGGTVGVGRSTTNAVVAASISVLVVDFFITKLWLAL